MIQRAKRRFLAIFWSLVCWINLILHILIVLNVFQLFTIAMIYEKRGFLPGKPIIDYHDWQQGPKMTVLANGHNVLNVQVGHVDKVKGNEGTVGTGETG